MSKRQKRNNIKQNTISSNSPFANLIETLANKNWICIPVIIIFLTIMFFKIGILHEDPIAHDTNQWRSLANETIEYNETHSDPALWTPNIFGGMPTYLSSFPTRYPFLLDILKPIYFLVDWKLLYLLIGALGCFFLLKHLGNKPFIATILSLCFSLSAHFVALIEMGHNTKFQAVMILPWLLFSFLYLRKKPSILGLGFFTVSLICELKPNHLQITYYFALFLIIYWIYELISNIKQFKKSKNNTELVKFTKFTLLIILGTIIAFMAVANPLLSVMEYSQFSMRGGSSGLTKEYAQGWSMHPLEYLSTQFFPDFFGGINQNYWGWMSFTQAYHYSGIIVFILAIFALFLSDKKYVKIMWIGIFASVLMSFGKYFPLLSNFLHDYLPMFNKFRVPATHLVIQQLLVIPLAAVGLSEIIKLPSLDKPKLVKILKISLFLCFGLFIINLALGKSIFMGMQFTSAGEMAQYKQYIGSPQFTKYLNELRMSRLDITVTSVRNGLFFITAILALIYFYSRKMLKKGIFIIALVVLMLSDLIIVDNHYFKTLYPKKESQEIPMNGIDRYLHKYDKNGSYRVFTRDNINDVSWAAHLQIIGGYHGAKLKRFNDVLNRCMNMNVINMLNAKYIITSEDFGKPLSSTSINGKKNNLYANPLALERAWFVSRIIDIPNIDKRLEMLNEKGFDPKETAIVEEKISLESLAKGEITQIPQKDYFHKVAFNVKNLQNNGFMVISEIYYPAGWEAFIDGKETKIYPVNHILRGIIVPQGDHLIEMKFMPKSYYISKNISLIGIIISLLILVIGSILKYRKNNINKDL